MSKDISSCDIFISYRREGGDMTAMYIYQELKNRGYNVFYDLEVLRAGKFNDALLANIRTCKDFILILSPRALDRCTDENDWVRRELTEALKTNKNIVPVMLNGFTFPEKLPDEIDEIRYRNGLTSTTEYFKESINRLCDKYLVSKPKKEIKGKVIIPAAAALAVILGIVLFFAFRSPGSNQLPPAAGPEPTVETTEEPTPVPEPTVEITEEPAPVPEPTVEITPMPVEMQTPEETESPASIPALEPTPGVTEAPREVPTSVPEPKVEATEELAPISEPTVETTEEPTMVFEPTVETTLMPMEMQTPEDTESPAANPALEPTPVPTEEPREVPREEPAPKTAEGAVTESAIAAYTSFPAMTTKGEEYDYSTEDFENWPVMGNADYRRSQIQSVMFLPSLESAPENAWDVSAEGDRRVLAWVDGEFNLFIAGDGGVRLTDPPGPSWMFSGYSNVHTISFNSCVDFTGRQDIGHMFHGCKRLKKIDFSGVSTETIRGMSAVFSGCESLEEIDLSFMDTSRVQTMDGMFLDCVSLKRLDVSGFDTSRVTDMSSMFGNCQQLETLNLGNMSTERVRVMDGMFFGCSRLRVLDVSGFDTSRAASMQKVFSDCHSLTKLDVSGWNTESAENLSGMFFDCFSLDSLDVSGWNTENVTDMSHMFDGCSLLYSLDLGRWNTGKVTDMSYMFNNDAELVEVITTDWVLGKVANMKYMFCNCSRLENIGREPRDFMRGLTEGMFNGCDKLGI